MVTPSLSCPDMGVLLITIESDGTDEVEGWGVRAGETSGLLNPVIESPFATPPAIDTGLGELVPDEAALPMGVNTNPVGAKTGSETGVAPAPVTLALAFGVLAKAD